MKRRRIDVGLQAMGKHEKSKYFSKTDLAKAFKYSSLNTFSSSTAHKDMMVGINFVVSRVEQYKDQEIESLKSKIRELVKE